MQIQFKSTDGVDTTLCDTCQKVTVELPEDSVLDIGWEEVDHGFQCPACSEVEREIERRDVEAGAVSLVGAFALTDALIGKSVEVDPSLEAMARAALKNGASFDKTAQQAALPPALASEIGTLQQRFEAAQAFFKKNEAEIKAEIESLETKTKESIAAVLQKWYSKMDEVLNERI